MIRIERQDSRRVDLSDGFDRIVDKNKLSLFSFENGIPKLRNLRGKIWVWCGYNWDYQGFMMRQQLQ